MKIIDNLQDPGQEMDFGLGDYFDGDEPEDSDSQQPDDVSDDSLDDVNVIMANDQQYGMFDVKKGKAKSIISPLASKN